MNILNDVEKAAVSQFMAFETMREAVKKVLLSHIYNCGVLQPGEPADPHRNRALVLVQQHKLSGNEQVGAALRAFEEATTMVESAFKELDEYKKVDETTQPKKNRAR
jgi:hypothetical protein